MSYTYLIVTISEIATEKFKNYIYLEIINSYVNTNNILKLCMYFPKQKQLRGVLLYTLQISLLSSLIESSRFRISCIQSFFCYHRLCSLLKTPLYTVRQ